MKNDTCQAALTAVLALRPQRISLPSRIAEKGIAMGDAYRDGYRDALERVHEVVARIEEAADGKRRR